ncbi:hypothetical protein PUV54_15870 [Hyphococcus flavus]|uniref:Uncharacterized protein n=1 Tax=Hyphococcus flavus TaxID=1866326 RepID=A0AAE9ZEP7_9PROT|nr:hypothetical protein [Hyphococcus flavus]WDI31428.1 hypothetical protein PUV54_15870 [Hyphococcus flavus]
MDKDDQPKGVSENENYFFTCTAHCDCGTALGSGFSLTEEHIGGYEESIRDDLQKKGWSAAKIQRRLNDLKKTQQKNERALESLSLYQGDEIKSWMMLISALLERRLSSHIGVTVNDYHGLISNPKFDLKRKKENLSALSSQILKNLAPATLVVFS